MQQERLPTGPGSPGLAAACASLAAGRAVVDPNPPPMAYGLVATTAREINATKGRALNQNVAVSLHDPTEWHPPDSLPGPAADRLGRRRSDTDRHLSMLLPLRAQVPLPGWVSPAARAGHLSPSTGGGHPQWPCGTDSHGSSAAAPIGSAWLRRRPQRKRGAHFGPACAVIDGEALTDPSQPPGASTMVRLDRRGRLSLHRSGAHDQTWPAWPDAYLAWLADTAGEPG